VDRFDLAHSRGPRYANSYPRLSLALA
jgi:hypothetical protein